LTVPFPQTESCSTSPTFVVPIAGIRGKGVFGTNWIVSVAIGKEGIVDVDSGECDGVFVGVSQGLMKYLQKRVAFISVGGEVGAAALGEEAWQPTDAIKQMSTESPEKEKRFAEGILETLCLFAILKMVPLYCVKWISMEWQIGNTRSTRKFLKYSLRPPEPGQRNIPLFIELHPFGFQYLALRGVPFPAQADLSARADHPVPGYALFGRERMQ
jgi:hypothetical protein